MSDQLLKEEILQMNKDICIFLGAEYCEYPRKIFPGEMGYQFSNDICGSGWWNEKSLAFHSNWEWIMQAGSECYRKMKELPKEKIISGFNTYWKILTAIQTWEKEKVFKAIHEFTKWYQQYSHP